MGGKVPRWYGRPSFRRVNPLLFSRTTRLLAHRLEETRKDSSSMGLHLDGRDVTAMTQTQSRATLSEGRGRTPGSKKQKKPEPRGEKRTRDEGEVIGGLLTLHYKGEWEPLSSYPLDGKVEELGVFEERTGQPLFLDKVKTARARELSKMEEHEVKKDISWDEARRQGLKIVRSRWVDGWKPLPNDPNGVRSRCVAQEINDHERDDVFSGTPPLRVHRMIFSAAATAKKGRTSRRKLIARYDVSVAFFHAIATGKIAVVPPKDPDQSMLWFLLKAMNGTREASRQWAKRV